MVVAAACSSPSTTAATLDAVLATRAFTITHVDAELEKSFDYA
jgi:hypothetical protein